MRTLLAPQQEAVGVREVLPRDDASGLRFGSSDTAERPLKVLLVDDSRVSLVAARRIVQELKGVTVIEARDGTEAMGVMARESPALVLTDLDMPRMNGLQLVEEIRKFYPETPVVLMTAHGSEQVAVEALRAGAANYVPKHAMAEELLDTLKSVLSIAETDRRKQRVRRCLESREARFRIENDPELIAPLVEMLVEDMRVIETCDSASRIRVGVALQEALANALFHGNLEVGSDLRQEDERHFYALAQERRLMTPYCERHVEVHSSVDRRAARFTINDEGPGFDTSTLLRPVDEEGVLKIGGRGMLLIRAFMDEVQHNEAGNRITLTKRHSSWPGR